MNPNTDKIYAAITGLNLPYDSFDLGHGVSISKTFGHFMAPFLMAFAPTEPGRLHPAPWSAVKGGYGFDFKVQLYIPQELELKPWLDRLNTVWLIASLMRLKSGTRITVPVITDKAFSEIPKQWEKAVILPVEAYGGHLVAGHDDADCTLEDLIWIRDNWIPAGKMTIESKEFYEAYLAYDSIGGMFSDSLKLITLWGALEHLFSPAKQELRFRVSALIATFLEDYGNKRYELHKKLIKLYDARSQVAHGSGLKSQNAYLDTREILRRVLVKIIQGKKIINKADIEKLIFQADENACP